MSEDNKAAIRRVWEEGFGGGNADVADDVYSPDYVDNDPAAPPEMSHGPEGVKQQIAMYRGAFPDMEVRVEDQLADGDCVITRWSCQGAHQGELMGIPPSGNQVTITGITISRFDGDKVREEWTNWDGLGMMQQIGAIPAGQAAS